MLFRSSPLTPLEGFAFKKAVISTNTHGIPHVVKDRENGLLVEPEDYRSLASAILQLLRNDRECTQYGLAGYELVQNICNSKKMARSTLEIYQHITNR